MISKEERAELRKRLADALLGPPWDAARSFFDVNEAGIAVAAVNAAPNLLNALDADLEVGQ